MMRIPIIDRFWPKVALNDATGCWEWTSTKTPHGYGLLWDPDRKGPVYTHRFAYERFIRPIGDLTLDHLCRNPSCCNPIHLEPVPLKENILRGVSPPAHNAKKTHCPVGHVFNKDNTYVRPSTGYRSCRICQRATNDRHKEYRNEWKRNKRRQEKAQSQG